MRGINLGSGERWTCQGWAPLDELDGNYLDENSIFPFEDESINYVYSSHFFEHINDSTAQNLIKECHRVLKKGGTIRILVPNFELMLEKYKTKDTDWFFNKIGFKGRPDWVLYDIKSNLLNVFLHWLSNHDFNGPNGWARIPIQVKEKEFQEKIKELEFGELCDWVHSHIPINDPRVKAQHINWWNMDKFKKFFGDFFTPSLSSHLQSDIPEINNGQFDSMKDRSALTLHVEGKK
jgi:predicted SAM-dependent methyltransferase